LALRGHDNFLSTVQHLQSNFGDDGAFRSPSLRACCAHVKHVDEASFMSISLIMGL